MPQLGLVTLLIAELVYLTVRFDSQALDRASSPWLHLVAWSPQYLRLAITVAVTALVLKTWRLAGPTAARAPAKPSARLTWLAVHVASLLLFVRITATVFDPALADRNAGMWVTMWFVLGAATLGAWALALWPRRIPWLESRNVRAFAGVAAALGGAACLSGYVAEALWQPLARTTFRVVGAMLGVIYPQVVSQPDRLRLGTPGFAVRIAPECSGYEGIGLLLAFLAVYLWVYRRELRFPAALVLLPIGAVTMWVVNALRIVALIAIGTAGWREIALGGFHSQAGWIAFNAIALSFVVLLNRGRYFRNEAAVATVAHHDDATPAYLVPFLVVVACAMITGAFAAGIDWLYPVRVVAAAWMLWLFRRSYAHLGWTDFVARDRHRVCDLCDLDRARPVRSCRPAAARGPAVCSVCLGRRVACAADRRLYRHRAAGRRAGVSRLPDAPADAIGLRASAARLVLVVVVRRLVVVVWRIARRVLARGHDRWHDLRARAVSAARDWRCGRGARHDQRVDCDVRADHRAVVDVGVSGGTNT